MTNNQHCRLQKVMSPDRNNFDRDREKTVIAINVFCF
jgi:hypothetical protein